MSLVCEVLHVRCGKCWLLEAPGVRSLLLQGTHTWRGS